MSNKSEGYKHFLECLAVATVTEHEVAPILATHFNATISRYNDDNRYDVKLKDASDKYITVEIKEDFTCARTGNIGIEYHCRGKKSGIDVTEAGYYCIKAHTSSTTAELLLMTVADLKSLIVAECYFRKVNGGDPASQSLNYLFKLDVIRDISITL